MPKNPRLKVNSEYLADANQAEYSGNSDDELPEQSDQDIDLAKKSLKYT